MTTILTILTVLAILYAAFTLVSFLIIFGILILTGSPRVWKAFVYAPIWPLFYLKEFFRK
jgi:hypothetical protein